MDWERNRLHVRSPETEHPEGGGNRVLPLFPELRTHLINLFEESPEGAVHVISRTRDGAVNLRTQFCRLIRRAGFKPGLKLWHNLRASREAELTRSYDLATVCRWIGNSPEAVTFTGWAIQESNSPSISAEKRQPNGDGAPPLAGRLPRCCFC